MPPPSKKRKRYLDAAERATAGVIRKRARLLDELFQPGPSGSHTENSEEERVEGINQPGSSTPEIPPNGASGSLLGISPVLGTNPETDSNDSLTHNNTLDHDTKSAYNRPPTTQEALYARNQIDAATRTRCRSGGYIYQDLDPTTRRRLNGMEACLNHFVRAGSKNFLAASIRAAEGQDSGAPYARRVRQWIRTLIDTGDLPYFEHGWWNASILEDEDIVRKIKIHLEKIGKLACAEDVVEFLADSETRDRLGIPKGISLRTAQRWMQRCGGFRWRKTPKGQYFDGHERDDVVKYRQETFLPFWRELERFRTIYNEKGEPDLTRPMLLKPGEKPVIIWFHDESIFFANDRRIVRWVGENEHATPFKKGEGATIMVANFVSAEFGWLQGVNGKSARVLFRPGVNRDGYFTCNRVVEQLENAIEIVKEAYPEYTHVFIYDNAPSHTKRPEDAITARQMPKKPAPVFPRPIVKNKQKIPAPPMEPGKLPDGRAQSFYFPDDHPEHPGWFKGMAEILRERGMNEIAEKPAQCRDFKCEEGRTDCCCRRALFCQPDFESRESTLAETAQKLGTKVVFLPKYHCELNPIEQCWGYAKEKYRKMPETNRESVMKQYVIDAVDSVPLLSIRKFAARTQRCIDAYAMGRCGAEATEWATKMFRSHRQTPRNVDTERIFL